MAGINPRWEAFKNNLLLGMGQREAYEAVKGYKAVGSAADAAASKLLRNDKFLKQYKKDLDKLKVNALLTKERILLEELCIAHSKIGDLYQGYITIPPDELPENVQRAVSGVSIREVEEKDKDGKTTIQRFFKYRFWNKGQALERLERHLGLFKEDNEQKGGDGVSIQVLVVNEKE